MTPIMVHLTMIGVGHDVPLAAVDLLACVVAAKQEPPVKPLPKVVANTTDPDSRVMPTRRGYAQGYNAQVAVTSDHISDGPLPRPVRSTWTKPPALTCPPNDVVQVSSLRVTAMVPRFCLMSRNWHGKRYPTQPRYG